MKAFICSRYGAPDVLDCVEIAKPSPTVNEVLVRIYATTVTSADWRIRSLDLPRGFASIGRLIFGFSRPRQPILGSEFAGVVEAVGSSVTKFKPGDEVFGFRDAAMGCHAEYVTMQQDGAIAMKPTSHSFGQAAALSFGGTTALGFLRRARIKADETILINGASGSVGSAAVQIARHFGARVSAMTSSSNVELLREIGAHDVIDYTQENFAQRGMRWDVIMDTVGTLTYRHCKSALAPKGRVALVAADLPTMVGAPLAARANGHRVLVGPTFGSAENIRYLASLAESGSYRPVIDSTYAFADLREAHRRVDSRRKRGAVVVTLR